MSMIIMAVMAIVSIVGVPMIVVIVVVVSARFRCRRGRVYYVSLGGIRLIHLFARMVLGHPCKPLLVRIV
jgi:hypothetical protein